MVIKKILIIIAWFVFFANQAFSFNINEIIKKSDKLKLYKNKEWLNLLHYNNNKSIIQDKKFFISNEGYKNPHIELNQTIKSLFSNKNLEDNNTMCKYPMRYLWIKKKLNLKNSDFPYYYKVKCKYYNEYLNNLSATKIYLVFVSENLNSPASMMGHIFIKIEGSKNNRNVSNALTYFANYVKGESILKFYIKSIFTGSLGYYYMTPYSQQINEYVSKEKRNLWEFELKLSQEQKKELLAHIWEMKGVNVKYNFFKHNCGTAIENLIDITFPNILSNNVFDTPTDIIKTLNKHNLIVSANIISNKNYKYQMIKNNFTRKNKKYIKNIIKTKNLDEINDIKSNQLKSNIIYTSRLLTNKENKNFINKLNTEASKVKKPKLNYEIKNPLLSNNSTQLLLGYERIFGLNSLKINFAPVYNDITDNNYQYFNEFELKLFDLNMNYFLGKNRVKIDNFNIIKLQNITPSDNVIKYLSNQIQINFENTNFDYNSNKLFPNIKLGLGKSKEFFKAIFMPYLFLNIGYSYYNSNDIVYINPEIGFFVHDTDFSKLLLDYQYYFNNKKYKYDQKFSIIQSFFINRNNEMRFEYNFIKNYQKNYNDFNISYKYFF